MREAAGRAPLHPSDVPPSFSLDREHGLWVCFHQTDPRTGKYLSGDAVEFRRRYKGLPYQATTSELRTLCSCR